MALSESQTCFKNVLVFSSKSNNFSVIILASGHFLLLSFKHVLRSSLIGRLHSGRKALFQTPRSLPTPNAIQFQSRILHQVLLIRTISFCIHRPYNNLVDVITENGIQTTSLKVSEGSCLFLLSKDVILLFRPESTSCLEVLTMFVASFES